jgi:hypothetical protein
MDREPAVRLGRDRRTRRQQQHVMLPASPRLQRPPIVAQVEQFPSDQPKIRFVHQRQIVSHLSPRRRL